MTLINTVSIVYFVIENESGLSLLLKLDYCLLLIISKSDYKYHNRRQVLKLIIKTIHYFY